LLETGYYPLDNLGNHTLVFYVMQFMRPRLHGSVCLSVPEPNLRTKGRMKLKIGRKKPLTHVTRDPHLEVERSNTCQGRVGKFQCRTICVFYSEVNSKKLLRLKKCN